MFFFFRLPIIIKTILVMLIGIVYTLFIESTHAIIFHCYDSRVQYVSLEIITLINYLLIPFYNFFFLVQQYHCIQYQWHV